MMLVYAVPVAAATALAAPLVLLAVLRAPRAIARWVKGRCWTLSVIAAVVLCSCNTGDDSAPAILGCGDFPCDAGTGGVPADAGDADGGHCTTQDPTCATFPHAVVCRPDNGVDACTFEACVSGWENCNGDATDGCEVDVTSDPGNCGNCGSVCASGGPCGGGVCQ